MARNRVSKQRAIKIFFRKQQKYTFLPFVSLLSEDWMDRNPEYHQLCLWSVLQIDWKILQNIGKGQEKNCMSVLFAVFYEQWISFWKMNDFDHQKEKFYKSHS